MGERTNGQTWSLFELLIAAKNGRIMATKYVKTIHNFPSNSQTMDVGLLFQNFGLPTGQRVLINHLWTNTLCPRAITHSTTRTLYYVR